MTIRRRIKQKWHLKLEDFEFKKASYNPNGSKTFEVWYKNDFIGDCKINHLFRLSKDIFLPNYIKHVKDVYVFDVFPRYSASKSDINFIGKVYCTGQKNGFPTKIVYVEIYPEGLNVVAKRKMLLEKYPDKIKGNKIIDTLLKSMQAR